MSSSSVRPLPSPPAIERTNESLSIFSNLSGPVEVHNGTFSATGGGHYSGTGFHITINNGGRGELLTLQPSGSNCSRPHVDSIRPRTFRPLPSVTGRNPLGHNARHDPDRDSAVFLSELSEQIRKLKERKEQLEAHESELTSRERRLECHTQTIRVQQTNLQRKEEELLHRESKVKELEERFERLALRVREEELTMAGLYECSQGLYYHDSRRNNATSPLANSSNRALDPVPTRALLGHLTPLSPNRGHYQDSSGPSFQRAAALLEGRDSVPHQPGCFKDRRPPALPLSPIGEDQQQAEYKGSSFEFTARSESPTTYRMVAVSHSSGYDRFLERRDPLTLDSPPQYSEIVEPYDVSAHPPREVSEKKRRIGQSPSNAPGTPSPPASATSSNSTTSPRTASDMTPNTTPPGSAPDMSFFGCVYKDHVDDIDDSERADAISWTVQMLVETGEFNEMSVRSFCGRVSESMKSTSAAVESLQREIKDPRSNSILLRALQLLRMMLANGHSLFRELCSRSCFMAHLQSMLEATHTRFEVRERTREVIEEIKKGTGEAAYYSLAPRWDGSGSARSAPGGFWKESNPTGGTWKVMGYSGAPEIHRSLTIKK